MLAWRLCVNDGKQQAYLRSLPSHSQHMERESQRQQLQVAEQNGLDPYQEPVPSRFTEESRRLEPLNAAKVPLRPHDPKSSATLVNHPLLKELQCVTANVVPGRNAFDMEHTFDPIYILSYIDRFNVDPSSPILSNDEVNPFQLQLRLIVLLVLLDARRPADLTHILSNRCSVRADKVSLFFTELKKQEKGSHVITYAVDPTLPPHRNLCDILTAHLRNLSQVEDSVTDPSVLIRCKSSDGTGSLIARAATPNTMLSWIQKLVLTPAGFPEFNGYALVKAAATTVPTRSGPGQEPSVTRWKSKFVAFRHYVKSGARVWPPVHLREDKDELRDLLNGGKTIASARVFVRSKPTINPTLGAGTVSASSSRAHRLSRVAESNSDEDLSDS
ncbi:hypothetical protein HDU93_005030, partial [Gonapodya sp. JEL0774]